jgi:outer membrane protein TolC
MHVYCHYRKQAGFICRFLTGIMLLSAAIYPPGYANTPDTLSLSIEEALEIGLVNSYLLRKGVLDLSTADAQVREAWGTVYPQVTVSANYTRNVVTANPFAGTEAGGLFQTFASLEWLNYNERARTDGDPETVPLEFQDYLDRQREAYEEAGIRPLSPDDDPFSVDNQFMSTLSISQTLYSGRAFAAIRGAEIYRKVNRDGLERDRQQVAHQIKVAYYSAQLAQQSADILRRSIERTRRTVEEIQRSVEQGILSKSDRLSAEVELVNLETDYIEAANNAEISLKHLNIVLGIPVRTNLRLVSSLRIESPFVRDIPSMDEAIGRALENRPDIQQVEGLIELERIQRNLARASYFPEISAFANLNYLGNVPDRRRFAVPDPDRDFSYNVGERTFFADAYWNPSVAVGVQFSWRLFTGFQTTRQVQQRNIAIQQAMIQQEQLREAVYLEVLQSVRNLNAAYNRIRSQERNIEQAELNHEFAIRRLQEGAGTALEERQASMLLDQSRLSYLSAVYDYLIAVSEYEKAIGEAI